METANSIILAIIAITVLWGLSWVLRFIILGR